MDWEHLVVAVLFSLLINLVINATYMESYSWPWLAAIGLAILGVSKVLSLGVKGSVSYWYTLAFAAIATVLIFLIGSHDYDTFWWSSLILLVLLVVDIAVVLLGNYYKKMMIDRNILIANVIGDLILGTTLAVALWH